jgi:hypothetical protein
METPAKTEELNFTIDRENLIVKLQHEKTQAMEAQKRRHEEWNENYLLYRLKSNLNRLTMRQEACLPLMKGSIKTVHAQIAVKPDVYFLDKAGDQDREITINEKWNEDFKRCQMELLDKADKKQELLYGRTWQKLNWIDGQFVLEIKDIFTILPDSSMKPHDVESASYIVETGIFRTLEDIKCDPKYNEQAKLDLSAIFFGTGDGQTPITTSGHAIVGQNQEQLQNINNRLESIGATNIDDTKAGANIIVSLDQHFTQIWNWQLKKWVRYVCTMAEGRVLLLAKPLKEMIGVEFWPLESWVDDLEPVDIYPDGTADILRTANQMINVWYGQYMENRTLVNFGMNFYDSTAGEGWEPVAMDPRPGGWYPLPGKPQEVYQRVDIPDLGLANQNAINFLTQIAEKETASSDIEKGVIDNAKQTLGEVQIAVAKTREKTSSMTPYFNNNWERIAGKWYLITIANMGKRKETLYKKAPNDKLVAKEITVDDIKSPKGYKIVVQNNNQRLVDIENGLTKLFAIKKEFPNNIPLNKAIQKRALKIVELSPEEEQEILEFEDRQSKLLAAQAVATPSAPAPANPAEMLPTPEQIPAPVAA